MTNTEKHEYFYGEIANKLRRYHGELPSLEEKWGVVKEINNLVVDNKARLPILYRYSPADIYNILSLLNGGVYLISASKMNDKAEGKIITGSNYYDGFERKLDDFRDDTLLKSFCSLKNDCYLWESYGDAHKGICVEFDFSRAEDVILRHLYPVYYDNNAFSCGNPKELKNHPYFYLRKDKTEWKKEQEWRFVFLNETELRDANPNTKKLLNYDPRQLNLSECINAIYLGARMPENMKKSITRVFKSMRVPIYEESLKEHRRNKN